MTLVLCDFRVREGVSRSCVLRWFSVLIEDANPRGLVCLHELRRVPANAREGLLRGRVLLPQRLRDLKTHGERVSDQNVLNYTAPICQPLIIRMKTANIPR